MQTTVTLATASLLALVIVGSGCEEQAANPAARADNTPAAAPTPDPSTDPTVSRPPQKSSGFQQPALGKAKSAADNLANRVGQQQQRAIEEIDNDR